MPYKIAKQGDRYYLVKAGGPNKGKRGTTGPGQTGGPLKKGGHKTRAGALAQMSAINMSLRRAAGKSVPRKKR
jgi:hypothetical protein